MRLRCPAATYRGRGIRRAGNAWVMDGTLTIRGVSKTVPLTFSFKGLFPDRQPASRRARPFTVWGKRIAATLA
jgi:polyisoprenoid-binding protein YceI